MDFDLNKKRQMKSPSKRKTKPRKLLRKICRECCVPYRRLDNHLHDQHEYTRKRANHCAKKAPLALEEHVNESSSSSSEEERDPEDDSESESDDEDEEKVFDQMCASKLQNNSHFLEKVDGEDDWLLEQYMEKRFPENTGMFFPTMLINLNSSNKQPHRSFIC